MDNPSAGRVDARWRAVARGEWHSRSWHGPFVHRRAGVRMLDIAPSHLMQRRDALQPALLEMAHHLGLPDCAGAAASNPRFDDTEVPVTVVSVHAPGVEPG